MDTSIISIIMVLFFATIFSGQAQTNSNRVNAEIIFSQQTTTRDSIQQTSRKTQVEINGTDNLIAIETTTANDTNSVNKIAINGTRNAVRIKQGTSGRVMIRQNGSGNHVSVIQNKEELSPLRN